MLYKYINVSVKDSFVIYFSQFILSTVLSLYPEIWDTFGPKLLG